MISSSRHSRFSLAFGLLIVIVPWLLGNAVTKKLPQTQPEAATGKIEGTTAGRLQLADFAAPTIVRKKLPPTPTPPALQAAPDAAAPQAAVETAKTAQEEDAAEAGAPLEEAPEAAAGPAPAVASAPPLPAAEPQPEPAAAALPDVAKEALSAISQKESSIRTPDPRRSPHPFSLLLSSCREKESAEAATHYFRRDGIAPYMVQTDLGGRGTWWRVLSGSYRSLEAALQTKKALNLSDAVVVKTPFANLVGEFSSEKDAAEQSVRLRRKGISAYLVTEPGQSVLLLIGAFPDRQTAEQYQRRLDAEGIATQVVVR